MPPNKKGGKNYKKGKHVDDDPIIYDRLPDQMYGRVIKLLGGCNALVYCNDNCERLCHIRGSMRKKVWLSTGDIVLLSLRELDTNGNTPSTKIDRGDICAKYDPKVIYRLREKDKTINEKLFLSIEKTDGSGQKSNGIPDDIDGFIFEGNNALSDSDDDSEEDDNNNKPVNRVAQKRAMMTDDDFDIDDI
jgi:translation initiation factor 1A